ncbi:ThuA domain-containing protein [Anaeromicropila herbilytica]|uniref:Trehalose utilization protein ThuA n=1 Tax=Anaeromicropila herbilytica TaxID=2785025 RepID=A0A7R7EJ47_9FIRM|nr:ThuA domain-containing protein [Anaeromicropila herbilytica]BCN30100.1 trehalose utilization protein ThuA [Anaeromicropila herbilytica]
MIRVTVWNEYIHEQKYEGIRKVYPKGIHGCIAEFLEKDENITVQCATLDMSEHGLTEEVLANTDVLIWWGHCCHEGVSDEVVERVKKYVLQGMGLIALHSAHHSKIMKSLLGTSLNLKWHHGDKEKLICVNPSHPIAAGVSEQIILEEEEMYGEYFDIPKPDDVVFLGWFASGEVFRSGCTFTRGRGKIFYFQPGHEEYPIYYMTEIQKIITNAVYWATPVNYLSKPYECKEAKWE